MAPPFSRLLDFLKRLNLAKVPYTLRHSRNDALMVIAFAPGEYWEIDFIENGDIEIEKYRNRGEVETEDGSILEELFALWSEDNHSTHKPLVDTHEAIAGK